MSLNGDKGSHSLRIALVMRDYSQARGGAERYFVNLSRALVDMGHEVHIFAAVFTGPQEHGIHLHRVPMMAKPAFMRLLSFFLNARRMIREYQDRLDVVQSLTMVYPCDIFRLGGEVQREWLKIRCPSPFARIFKLIFSPVYILNLYFEKNIMDLKNTRAIITISALEKEILLQYYDYPEDRITVVYNGVDHRQFHPGVKQYRDTMRRDLSIGDAELVGLFSANNFHRKGLDAVIAALPFIPKKDRPKILVIGRGKPFSYRRQAKRLGVSDSVFFVGPVADPEKFYGASDFLVLPSRYDSFGNVHLEALACGLPVITTKMAGGSEVVRPGETGFVLGGTDRIEDLADAMTRLGEPGLREQMARLAPVTVQNFTSGKNAEETLNVFQRVLRERAVLS
jgi:UDP-glucose:(heptosyl)LPS alpha-1,3-glucosyltransferase